MTYNQTTMADTDVIAPGALKGMINVGSKKAGCAYRMAPRFDPCDRPAVVKVANHDRNITAWLCAHHAQQLNMSGLNGVGISIGARRTATPDDQPSVKWQIITHVVAGDSDKEIAAAVGLSETTVGRHIGVMCNQSGARNRTHLAVLFITGTYRP